VLVIFLQVRLQQYLPHSASTKTSGGQLTWIGATLRRPRIAEGHTLNLLIETEANLGSS